MTFAIIKSLKTKELASVYFLFISFGYLVILCTSPLASGLHGSGRYILPMVIICSIYGSLYIKINTWSDSLILGFLAFPSILFTYRVLISENYAFGGQLYGITSRLLPSLYCPGGLNFCEYSGWYVPLSLFILLLVYFNYKYK